MESSFRLGVLLIEENLSTDLSLNSAVIRETAFRTADTVPIRERDSRKTLQFYLELVLTYLYHFLIL